jgi:hypothetical protein
MGKKELTPAQLRRYEALKGAMKKKNQQLHGVHDLSLEDRAQLGEHKGRKVARNRKKACTVKVKSHTRKKPGCK